MDIFEKKYIKYKKKYLNLKEQIGSSHSSSTSASTSVPDTGLFFNYPQLSDHPLCSYLDILFWNIEKEQTYQQRIDKSIQKGKQIERLEIEERNIEIANAIISKLENKNFVCLQEFTTRENNNEPNNETIITRLGNSGFRLVNFTPKSTTILDIPEEVYNNKSGLTENYIKNDSGNAIFVRNTFNTNVNGGEVTSKNYSNSPEDLIVVRQQRGLGPNDHIPIEEITHYTKFKSYFNWVIYENGNNLLINLHGEKKKFTDLINIVNFINNRNENLQNIIVVGDFNKPFWVVRQYLSNINNFDFTLTNFTLIDHAISIQLKK